MKRLRLFPILLVPLAFFSTAAAAATDTQTQTLYLSGHNKDDAVPWSFSCTAGQHANIPSQIPVPSNWELHDFGIFSYGVEHRGSKTKPATPPPTVTGHYQTHFTLPPAFANKRIFLVFEGVMTDTTALINGKSVGETHQGGYTRFKYEITNLLTPGQNTLDVTVSDESANPSVNNAERRGDYFNYAGIYRPVYLEAVPQQFIDHVAINATADGNFSLDTFTNNATPDESLEAQIVDSANHPIGDPFTTLISPSQIQNQKSKIKNPLLWTAETPNLYTLKLSLKQNNQLLHSLTQRFGFRTIDPRPDGLYVNGQRILLKGSDRHSFWPDSGRCLSEQISRDDIALMHQMNMNAVRMSHYPPDAHFLDACDEMGLYVLDELPGWHGHYDDDVGHKLVTEMVARDVNHPSILFWDNGNEGGWNTRLDPDFPALDPQKRHVLHPWELHDGIDTKHYPDFKTLTAKVNGPNLYFPTEMLHGLYDGGAGAGLEDYWNTIMHGKAAGGGFIWAFLDEAPKRVDLDGHLDTRGNLAPDGIVGPYREKEASFYTIKQLWSPVVITDKELPKDGQLHIENRYSFINLKDCKFSYQLRKFPAPSENTANFTILKEGKLDSPNLGPAATGTLGIDPSLLTDSKADALAIRIENPAGQELFTPVFPFTHLDAYRDSGGYVINTAAPRKPITVDTTATALTVKSDALTVIFDPTTGYLASVTSHGKTYALTNGPRLIAGDLPHASLTSQVFAENELVTVVVRYGDGVPLCVVWDIHAEGWIGMLATYHATGPQDFIGLGFDYPEKNIKSLKWLGDGPFRVYANRTAGPTLSVWQNDYNDSLTGSIPWHYPEFKGYFQNIRWAQYHTTEGPITFLVHDPDTYLQNFTPTQPDKSLAGKTLVPYPATSIAFLKSIPPIGSKFSDATSTGPAGQPHPATGDYTTQLSIYFGELPR